MTKAILAPHHLRLELLELTVLADQTSAAFPQFENVLGSWRQQAGSLQTSLDEHSLADERALYQLALEFRYLWLNFSQSYSARIIRSPRHGKKIKMPDGPIDNYPYDRWNKAPALESRMSHYHPPVPGWRQEHVVYSSGMAAITAMLQMIRYRYSFRFNRAIRWLEFSSYFEVRRLFQLYGDLAQSTLLTRNENEFFEALRYQPFDMIFCQSVANDFALTPLNIEKFGEAWAKSTQSRPKVVVVDTTLTGNHFPFAQLLAKLESRPPSLIVRISSGLKLDQEGLEFANVGIVTLYAPETTEPDNSFLADFCLSLRRQRRTFGASLNIDALTALSIPCFLDPLRHQAHCQRLFENNANLAKQVTIGHLEGSGPGILKDKAHPALRSDAPEWACAPFVNFAMASAAPADKTFLRRWIRTRSDEQQLQFHPGSSFGFRAHRYEMGIIDEPGHSTFRVAMGSVSGPSFAAIVKLFSDLATYPDINSLKAAFPEMAAKAEADHAAEPPPD